MKLIAIRIDPMHSSCEWGQVCWTIATLLKLRIHASQSGRLSEESSYELHMCHKKHSFHLVSQQHHWYWLSILQHHFLVNIHQPLQTQTVEK